MTSHEAAHLHGPPEIRGKTCVAEIHVLQLLIITLSLLVTGPAQSQTTPTTSTTSSVLTTSPDLPPGVTLVSLATQYKGSCTFVGSRVVKSSIVPSGLTPLTTLMPTLLSADLNSTEVVSTSSSVRQSLTGTSSFAQAAEANLRCVLRQCKDRADVVEAVLKANTREGCYRNSEIIKAAEGHCDADRVAKWKVQYPDK